VPLQEAPIADRHEAQPRWDDSVSVILKMGTICYSATSVLTGTKRRHIPEDNGLRFCTGTACLELSREDRRGTVMRGATAA
jgi:hypothetical protein